MMRRIAILSAALLLLLVEAPWVSAADGGVVRKWTVDGVQREAMVFATPGPGKHPVIFVFHGHGGNMAHSSRMGFQNLWPEAIVVCMQGLPTPSQRDPQGLKPGWQALAGDQHDRDLKFFDAVLATLREKRDVDDSRIYATGFSNGGFFTYLLWEQRGKTFAALAPGAGLIRPGMKLTEPKPVLHIAGEADQIVPFDKQKETIQQDRQIDDALGEGRTIGQRVTLYASQKGAPVVTLIHPGGHVYPPGATKVVVEFFKRHALAQ